MKLKHIKNKYNDYYKDDQGRCQDESKWYRSNGRLYRHCHYKDGKFHGEYKSYNEDGSLNEHTYYENGKDKGLRYLKLKKIENLMED